MKKLFFILIITFLPTIISAGLWYEPLTGNLMIAPKAEDIEYGSGTLKSTLDTLSIGSGADALGFYLVTKALNAPTNGVNLGLLSTGLLNLTVSGGVATPSILTVGTAANNIVQLNGSSQLPAVSAALLTNFPTLNQNTTGTAANLSGTPALPNGTTATTQSAADGSTKLATTAYADALVNNTAYDATSWDGVDAIAPSKNAIRDYLETKIPALAGLDQALTYLKNIMVGCEGIIAYNKATGVLSWSDTIHIYFTDTDGDAKHNSIAAGSITLSDGEIAYVDLDETDDSVLTVADAAIVTSSDSNFVAYNRLVLAFRDAESDNIYSTYLRLQLNDPDKIVQALTDAASITVDWSKGSTATLTLARASTEFTFAGAYNGQHCVLLLTQYSGPGGVTFTSEVAGGANLTVPPALSDTDGLKDYLGFIFDGAANEYHLVSLAKVKPHPTSFWSFKEQALWQNVYPMINWT